MLLSRPIDLPVLLSLLYKPTCLTLLTLNANTLTTVSATDRACDSPATMAHAFISLGHRSLQIKYLTNSLIDSIAAVLFSIPRCC